MHKLQHEIVGKPADADATYWICAYANNQHDLSELDVKDPRDTPFFKAMQLCDGVLVILDKDGIVFTRIWCGFEQATVAQGKKLLLDIATVHNGEPELLTDGFAYECDDSEENKMVIKTEREKHFPVALLEKAYTIRVELGKASVKSYFEFCLQVQKDFLDSHLSSSTFQFTQMKMKMDCNNVRQTLTDCFLRLMRKENGPLDLSTHATMSIWLLKNGGTPADQATKIMWNRGGVKSRISTVYFDEATDSDSGEHAEHRPSVRPRYGSQKFYPKVAQSVALLKPT